MSGVINGKRKKKKYFCCIDLMKQNSYVFCSLFVCVCVYYFVIYYIFTEALP